MSSKKIIIIVIIGVVFVLSSLFFINKNGDHETFNVERTDFTEVVELSGKVVPSEELNLSFEVVGKVARVNVDSGDFVNRGDVLVELDVSEINSELNEVLSNLEKERSLLSEVSGDNQRQNRLENESNNLINTIKKTYVTSDDIVKNIVDIFFDNPNNRFPDFTNALTNYFLRQEINDLRREVGLMLLEWQEKLSDLDQNSVDQEDVNYAIENLKKIQDFLTLITSDIDDFGPTGNVTQSQIDSYLTSISNARNTVASLVVEINNTYDGYRSVLADIPVIESTVNNAQASVDKLSARKNKYVLRAPFSGIVTDKNIEVGEVVSAGENVISMISDAAFEVESFVPELNIIGVDVGDTAFLTFDAFGLDKYFDATVSHVNFRETIKDGITTYKILLTFNEDVPEVRSGMTNNIEIIKDFISSQIVIPRYLISEDEGGEYVYLLENDEKKQRRVVTGRIDGKGGIIIEEGLSEGDKVVIEKE